MGSFLNLKMNEKKKYIPKNPISYCPDLRKCRSNTHQSCNFKCEEEDFHNSLQQYIYSLGDFKEGFAT